MPELIQKTHSKSSFPIILIYYELSNPIYNFVIICLAASERVTGKAAVYGHPNVGAYAALGQVFRSKSYLTESYIATFQFLAGKENG